MQIKYFHIYLKINNYFYLYKKIYQHIKMSAQGVGAIKDKEEINYIIKQIFGKTNDNVK